MYRKNVESFIQQSGAYKLIKISNDTNNNDELIFIVELFTKYMEMKIAEGKRLFWCQERSAKDLTNTLD